MKKRKNIILIGLIILFILGIGIFFIYSKFNESKIETYVNINKNEVPYLSTYYIKPIVKPGENVILDFYISDYNHKSYTEENLSDRYTVTVKVDGKKDIIKKNLKAGDNSINIGRFKEIGEQKFSIICTDQYGRNSHELFNYFLVRDEPTVKEYSMTENDLILYNINNNDNKENGKNTREGLQKLLDNKKAEGYNKLKLLPGIYRIDHTGTIFIPTEFTLDLNQSTIRLNGFTGDRALMIELNNTFDSHVINGTIEGDYYEHDYNNSPNNSEWVNGIGIGGESKYSSFENLVVKNITGYGGGNGIANSRDGDIGYTYFPYKEIGDTFKLGDIDRKTGSIIESNNRTTSDFINIEEYSKVGYLSISRYLGYQGNPCDTWNLVCHFYDKDKNYINSIDSYQYRRVGVPDDAKYMKVTILGENYPKDLSIQLFRVPTHCAFKNVKFENCRAVGLAQAAMKDMLVENCEFTKSGQVLAKCAYDAEDGWDMMQDVTFRGLNFYDNPNNDFLTCAGHNFIVENMKDGKVYFWERTNSYVVRNCENLKSTTLRNSSRKQTGYVRFYDNTVNLNISILSEKNNNWPLVVKDSKINGNAMNSLGMGKYLRCDIGKSLSNINNNETALGEGEFIDSYIHDKTGENRGGIYINCKLENIEGNIHKTLNVSNSVINNIKFNTGTSDSSYIFKDSELNNFQLKFGYWNQGAVTEFENCKINNDGYLIELPHYSMKKPISLINNIIESKSSEGLIKFYDDRTGGSAGELVKQSTLTLEENKITLPNSKYVIEGLNEDTVNNINIIDKNNSFNKSSILLVDKKAKQSKNIFINN
ncbi:hypothetical protein [Clostridium perfringens]|uniref:hypothetical protein n=1 Tax=Clostridium perfringens TaxID=1502 RepID=UPI0018E414C1|nr:hypothetical protein [Clostridium perfringens]MBI6011086.1 hypothetical protein [Clostridium perfringens]MDB2041357.1 hypothetical protein [Clostridium perfringens]MDB2048776.1 hypothetical protein [Clostridium perfringens]MDB2051502.1 hypothetical protein [Clostridium perfringens]MDM0594470.1 hypothetical protein [Clostridium perfringens]